MTPEQRLKEAADLANKEQHNGNYPPLRNVS